MRALKLLDKKDHIVNMLESKKALFRYNDPVVKFLKTDHIADDRFQHNLRMLPIELIQHYGPNILQDETLYKKHYKPEYDVFQEIWNKHYQEYEKDRKELCELYLNGKCDGLTPLEIYNKLNDLMIKIERRSLVLAPQWGSATQKHTRQSGNEANYKFLRATWVDDDGKRKRMLNRLVGEKYGRLEREILDIFHNLKVTVRYNYRVNQNIMLDAVIERDKQLIGVEIKEIDEKTFDSVFVFDELVKRFKEDYPAG